MENNLEATEIGKICKANVNWLNRNELGAEIRGTKKDGGVAGILEWRRRQNLFEGICEEVKNLGPTRSKNELLTPKSIQSGKSKPILGKSVDNQERKLHSLRNGRVIVGAHSNIEVEDCVSSSSSECEENFRIAERVFFPEFESSRERKYGSMIVLQDGPVGT
ncbi:hypothetical protein V6N13_114270 [Hibiscus sabdariffa]|uniref:Uncharacterized protein n=1 Tax=Hibiscus sabdariffa TaxID=183260 RepID=A0ABR2U1I9_9ROSI